MEKIKSYQKEEAMISSYSPIEGFNLSTENRSIVEPNMNSEEIYEGKEEESRNQWKPTPYLISLMNRAENKLTSKEFEESIINIMRNEESLDLGSKIMVTRYILSNRNLFPELKDFYEEECHISLMNWVWDYKKLFKKMQHLKLNEQRQKEGEEIYIFQFCYVLELFNNIIIIYELLHIKSNDLIEIKMFEKFYKLKGYIKNFVANNFSFSFLFFNLSCLLDLWKLQTAQFNNETSKLLGNKRQRNGLPDEETAEDSDINNLSQKKISKTDSINSLPKHNNQKKKVTFQLNNNHTIYFDKLDEPYIVGIEKNSYDPLDF